MTRLTLGMFAAAALALALAGCGSSATKTITLPSPSTLTSTAASTAGFTTITSPPSTTAGSSTTSTVQTTTSTVPATTSTVPAATSTVPATTSTVPATTSAAPTATVRLATFRSPSSNIGCDIVDGGARCDIRQRSWSPPRHPASCPSEVDFGQGLQVGTSGAGGFVCAGDTALDPSAPALGYGVDSHVGTFTCASRTNGITCTNAKGHGFFIASEFYRLF